MKLTKLAWVSIASAAALVVGIGAGVGIGFGAFSQSASSGTTTQVNQLRNWVFQANEIAEPVLTQAALETYAQTDTTFPAILVSDGNGELNDQSFYENAGRGVLDIYGLRTGTNVNARLSTVTNLYRVPGSGSNSAQDLSSLYATAGQALGRDNKKVVIAPGFGHVDGVCAYQNTASADTTLQFLLIDNSFSCNTPNTPTSNVFSITFDVQESSFKAGYLATLYLNRIGDTTPTIGLWGGGAFPSIDSFLVGFVSGVKYFNDNNGTQQDIQFTKFANEADYRNSGFDAGKGRAKADFLVSQNTDVILPVAGGQTRDLIDSINAANRQNETKVIGVDADARVPYDSDKNLFLTSITKNLQRAIYQGYKCLTTDAWDITTTSTDTCTVQLNNGFVGSIATGFTDYVKQYSSTDGQQASFWKDIYDAVDAVSVSDMLLLSDWTAAYNYITAN